MCRLQSIWSFVTYNLLIDKNSVVCCWKLNNSQGCDEHLLHETVMSIYSDKLAHVQALINCPYSIAQLCTHEDTLVHNLGALYFDEVMSYYSLTTIACSVESAIVHNSLIAPWGSEYWASLVFKWSKPVQSLNG